jgi:hypothetical protein
MRHLGRGPVSPARQWAQLGAPARCELLALKLRLWAIGGVAGAAGSGEVWRCARTGSPRTCLPRGRVLRLRQAASSSTTRAGPQGAPQPGCRRVLSDTLDRDDRALHRRSARSAAGDGPWLAARRRTPGRRARRRPAADPFRFFVRHPLQRFDICLPYVAILRVAVVAILGVRQHPGWPGSRTALIEPPIQRSASPSSRSSTTRSTRAHRSPRKTSNSASTAPKAGEVSAVGIDE